MIAKPGALKPLPPVTAPGARPRRLSALKVFMRDLRIEAEIGVYAHEKGRRQPLVLDIEVELEPHSVVHVTDTVNYEAFAAKARKLADEGHIDLVETFAERLAQSLLDHPLVISTTIRVEKPEALGEAARVGVELTLVKF